MTPARNPRQVGCPICNLEVVWGPQSPYRPFCSARCRQIDLGAWASDSYAIPGSAPPDDFVSSAEPRPNE